MSRRPGAGSNRRSSSRGVVSSTVSQPPGIPTISGVDLGDTFGGSSLTLTGTNFVGITGVTIGGTPCTEVTSNGPTSLTCRTPAKAAGTYDIVVTGHGGASLPLVGGYEAWSPLTDFAAARVYQSDQGTTTGSTSRFFENKFVANPGALGAAPFTIGRDGVGLVSLDSVLYMLGGWKPGAFTGGVDTTNQVLKSTDNGATWTEVLAFDANPPQTGAGARWRRRHSAGCISHTQDGVSYVYVIGGDHLDVTELYPADVWRSSDGCVTWERVATDCPWGPRMLHMVASYDGDLYVLGGQSDISDPTTALRDVWKSIDGGANWTSLGNAGWAKRGAVLQPPTLNGLLYVIGGGTYDAVAANRTYYNDVWSFDGATWTEVLADGHGQWPAREYHNTIAYDSRLFVLLGFNTATGNLATAYQSADSGVTWTALPEFTETATHAAGACVHDGTITIVGGLHAADADNFKTVSITARDGAAASAWSDQGSAAKHLAQATGNRQPILVQGVMDGVAGFWFDGANDFMRLSAKDNTSADGWFWIAVARSNFSATEGALSAGQTLIGTVATSAYNQFGTTAAQVVYYEGDSAQYVRGGSGILDDQPRLLMASHKAGGAGAALVTDYIGTSSVASASKNYNATHTGWDSVGAGYSADGTTGDHFFKGFVGAVVVIKGDPSLVTGTIRTKLNKWAQKWGSVS